MRVDLQAAYILHTRPYRNTSLLVDLLTPDYGRVAGVAKGVRANSRAGRQRRAQFQPFTPLLVGWSGSAELKTITHFEARQPALAMTGKPLFSAMYLNELLCRVLQQQDESQALFALYQLTLERLAAGDTLDILLRRFELGLLSLLGYGIELEYDADSGEQIVPGCDYYFDVELGFRQVQSTAGQGLGGSLFRGSELLSLAAGDYTPEVRRMARQLCRQALQVHLGDKPLKSRELFA